MKIVQINVTCGLGSTGKICIELSKLLTLSGVQNYVFYSAGDSTYPLGIKYCNEKYIKMQAVYTRLNGLYGFNSYFATKKLLNQLDRINPDIIHLHNLHGHNCNLEMLFNYVKQKNIKILWTFHDCWAFTAYCPHFTMAGCSQWQTGCIICPQRRKFSWLFDKSEILYSQKKALIEDVDLTIVTPSKWLKDLTKQSFFSKCEVRLVYNGIDLSVFRPVDSVFRGQYNISSAKKIILGVAFDWGKRKGLDIFVRLAEALDPDNYQIVLVGTNDEIDRKLPGNIISIHRTQNQAELAEIYSAADLFVNPTREEVFGLVNVEALACGTPVVTFDTGGSPECIDDTCGSVVGVDDFDALKKEIIRICETKPYTKEACLRRAKQFDQNEKYKEYYELYKELI